MLQRLSPLCPDRLSKRYQTQKDGEKEASSGIIVSHTHTLSSIPCVRGDADDAWMYRQQKKEMGDESDKEATGNSCFDVKFFILYLKL